MQILKYIKEAFSSSTPDYIRDYLTRNLGKRRGSHVLLDFDPSTADFKSVKGIPLTDLRNIMRDGNYVMFIKILSEFNNPVTLRIDAQEPGKTEKLIISGDIAGEFKNKSFKYLMDNAIQIHVTQANADVALKRSERRLATKGLVSRKGDSAQDPTFRSEFDGSDWQTDASGYLYDANRLAKKLAEIHENDSAYTVKKAAKIFKDLINVYIDFLAKQRDAISDDSDTAIDDNTISALTGNTLYLVRNYIEDCGNYLKEIQADAKRLSMSLEEINDDRKAHGRSEFSEDDYAEAVKYLKQNINNYFLKVQKAFNETKKLVTK